jgi:alkanesulfonate monooxygenase SsuD/methylene tetrahydromethanopterin reductase-like flavin-dependent oxidoreductase (luciferase family)
VEYGLALPTGGECGDPRFLLKLAELAEASGWDGVFLEDYVWYQGDPAVPTCNTWTALAAIAVRTSRVTLGVEVVALPRRRPWNVAREAAAVDQLSGGRLVVGFGGGDDTDPGFTHVGEEVDARIRAERLDEGLEIVNGLWSGNPFSFRGNHYTVDEVTFAPVPLQRPRPPVWIGGGYPNSPVVERALRWDGSCMYQHEGGGHLTADAVRDLRSRAAGRTWTIAVGGQRRRPDWDEERDAIREVEAAGADWWVEWVPPAERGPMREGVERGPLRVD